jgi:hypothetical protein
MNATTDDMTRLRMAQLKWRVEVAEAVLKAHRSSGAKRDQQWRVEEALYAQQLENAQTYLQFLTTGTREPGRPRLQKVSA